MNIIGLTGKWEWELILAQHCLRFNAESSCAKVTRITFVKDKNKIPMKDRVRITYKGGPEGDEIVTKPLGMWMAEFDALYFKK